MPYREPYLTEGYQQQPIQEGQMGDPLLNGGADPGTSNPAPASYSGLTGDPLQTAYVTTAQLDALRPRSRPRRPRPLAPAQPFAGLSNYLGGLP